MMAGLVLILSSFVSQSDAQSQTGPSKTEPSIAELKKNYSDSIETLRTSVKDLKQNGLDYYYGPSETALKFKKQWETAAMAGAKAYHEVHINAFALFLALDDPGEPLTQVVYRLNHRYLNAGQLEINYRVTQKLYMMFPNDLQVQVEMARVAILTNDFETAQKLAQFINHDNAKFSPVERHLWNSRDSLALSRSHELKLQAAEATSDDLPRVELETTKGTIVLELFENEAPETVANFISLVDAEFYNDILFNFVLQNLIAVTGGISLERGPQQIGYTIHDESHRPDTRQHFRGTIAMYNPLNMKNIGNSMFYINLVPATDRELQTVFGRVISGMDVVERLQVTTVLNDKGEPEPMEGIVWDKIISAKIIRKRDHEYVPHIFKK